MNAQQFHDWLVDHVACREAMNWLKEQPKRTPSAIWKTCPYGERLLWWHERAGTDFEVLAPVAYLAINRAMKYAKVDTVTVVDRETAREAANAATSVAAGAARGWLCEEAGAAAGAGAAGSPSAAARGAAGAAGVAMVSENLQCAMDCRRLLKMPVMKAATP